MDFQEKFKEISNWFYRGEGNDTLVIGLKEENVVLRLKKRAIDDEASNSKSRDTKIAANLDFSKQVFLPLMGGKYVSPGEIVTIPEGFLAKMDELCRPFRPKSRLHKVIDTNCNHGVLMKDFCFLDDRPGKVDTKLEMQPCIGDCDSPKPTKTSGSATFSVEIKPKFGYIPSSPNVIPEHHVRHYVCYYCLLQYSKQAKGSITRRSRYCPVNLFSSDRSRVFYALETLVADPQNNLRIFKDGIPIYTQEILDGLDDKLCCPEYKLETVLMESGFVQNSTELVCTRHKCGSIGPNTRDFLEIILGILIHDSNYGVPGKESSNQAVINVQYCKENDTLPSDSSIISKNRLDKFGRGGILQQLLAVQKLDSLDIEGVHPLYLKLTKYFEGMPEGRECLGLDSSFGHKVWNDIVQSHHSKSLPTKDMQALLSLDLSDMTSLHIVLCEIYQFCIASTAKDCSLMVTFQRRSEPAESLSSMQDIAGIGFLVYNLDLVDLDLKEVDRIKKYMKDACETVQQYLTCKKI